MKSEGIARVCGGCRHATIKTAATKENPPGGRLTTGGVRPDQRPVKGITANEAPTEYVTTVARAN
jgi:hypothetical protein